MFRLTLSNKQSDVWVQKHPDILLSKPQKCRIYRWGTMWGILDQGWSVEQRILLDYPDEVGLLEYVVSCTADVPYQVDDVWEETYFAEDSVRMNGLVSVCLNASDLQKWCRDHDMPVPVLPTITPPVSEPVKTTIRSHTQLPHKNHQKKPGSGTGPVSRSGSGCLIVD
jgi:hypothetical protein